ncbi:PriCT-2 domain-containing protein [Bradyrhizobium sp. PRIMUS42]|uniref:PriCT-2 domain-containing protein n=1 Tax=Bradyrhizobium sp. PRIMUS42 TaxID=2908926 RepID=UPI001FF1D6B2|nr:PriCT-2 domain-containing protein [Bradyrhizobium sp. PRIMUS42]MCJ9728985.1 PriCT-2 domain-containing protein [Bradyrhizobium sp. PRIMUS42]
MSIVTKLKQPSIAEQMMRLFPASQRAHATYDPDESTHTRRADGKLAVPYRTVRKPVTLDLWKRHLAGNSPLVLSMACDDCTSGVSVVDVDQYDTDCTAIVGAIKAHKLPVYVRPSKSGGAHVYAFHDKPIPVAEATAVAEGMARRLVLTKVEFFPKPQNPDPAVLSKPLNMPYFGGAGGFIRPGSKVRDQMLVEEFLRNVNRLTAEQRAELTWLATPARKPSPRENRNDHVHDPVLLAIMKADADKGVSTDPDDYFADVPDLELKIRAALSVVPSDDYDPWFRIGAAIYSALGDSGFPLFDEWSHESWKYDPRACQRKWREFAEIRSIRVETIFWYADQHDRGWRALYRRLINGEVAA